jgi:hypothetical protein
LTASLQKNSRLSSSHKAQILLCSIEEGDGIGYHELFRVLEKDAVRDPLSKKVVSCVRDAMARTREEDTPLQYEGKGTFSQRIKDKLFSVDPHLLAFVLARNEFKIVQVLRYSQVK